MDSSLDIGVIQSLVLEDIGIPEHDLLHSRFTVSYVYNDTKIKFEFIVDAPDRVDSARIELGDKLGGFSIIAYRVSLNELMPNALKYEVEVMVISWADWVIRDIMKGRQQ